MPFFASQDRGTLRHAWREAWRRHCAGLALEPLETQIAAVAQMHPEYHAALGGDTDSLDRDWSPEEGQGNPFLHMSLHLAVRDSIRTDRPRGIRAVFEQLLVTHPVTHDAEHVLLDCLGETLWEAQRAGLPPDDRALLERSRRRAQGR